MSETFVSLIEFLNMLLGDREPSGCSGRGFVSSRLPSSPFWDDVIVEVGDVMGEGVDLVVCGMRGRFGSAGTGKRETL